MLIAHFDAGIEIVFLDFAVIFLVETEQFVESRRDFGHIRFVLDHIDLGVRDDSTCRGEVGFTR